MAAAMANQMPIATAQPVKDENYIPPAAVNLDNRENTFKAGCDGFFGVAWWVIFVAMLAVTFMVVADRDVTNVGESSTLTCPSGDISISGYEVSSDSLKDKLCACHASGHINRRLEMSETEFKDITMYKFFERKPHYPVICIFSVLAASVVWLLLIQYCAKPLTWLSVLLNCGVMIFGGCYMAFEWKSDFGYCFLIAGGVSLAYAIFRWKKLMRAAEFMAEASKALQDNCHIFSACMPLQLVYCLFLYAMYEMWLSVFLGRDVVACQVVLDERNYNKALFVQVVLTWFCLFLNHVKTNTVAMTVGTWMFNQNVPDKAMLPFRAMWTSLTKSSGTLAVTSFICAVTEDLRKRARNKWAWANPACCCLNILACVVAAAIQAFGRFSVVLHGITGMPFFLSAKCAWNVLKNNLESVLVTDFAGQSVIYMCSYVFSCAIGFMAWAFFDLEAPDGKETLKPGNWDSSGVYWVCVIFFFILNRYPMGCIFVINMFQKYFEGEIAGPVTGLFVANIAHLILSFVGAIILDAIDTAYICYAVQKANRQVVQVSAEGSVEIPTAKLYYLLEEEDKDAQGFFPSNAQQGPVQQATLAQPMAQPVTATALPAVPVVATQVPLKVP